MLPYYVWPPYILPGSRHRTDVRRAETWLRAVGNMLMIQGEFVIQYLKAGHLIYR
jgi:hypothetical protein